MNSKLFKKTIFCHCFLCVLPCMLVLESLAQDTGKEKLRKQAYQAQLAGDLKVAIENYEKVLALDGQDYDALLATARLYFKLGNYEKSIFYFSAIYKKDQKDVEALNGLGECYLETNKVNESIDHFQLAIHQLPNYVPLHVNLAKAYLLKDDLGRAIGVYRNILQVDSTCTEAWWGIGKILFWQNKPKSALPYYEHTLLLDPGNKEIKAQYRQVLNELAYTLNISCNLIKEEEQNFSVATFRQRNAISKRVNDHIRFSVSTFFDHAVRNRPNWDTTRIFNQVLPALTFIRGNHQVSVFLGASESESQATAYGLNWVYTYAFSKIKIRNIFSAGYDYFFYWNQVEQDYLGNSVRISWNRFYLDAGLKNGVVRNNYILDYYEKDKNPYLTYNLNLNYRAFNNPRLNFSLSHSFLNYEFRSPLYFSPYKRSLTGFSLGSYYTYRHFYFYGGFSFRQDNYTNSVWGAEAEMGYTWNKVSFSVGGSHYDDPYYKNSILNVSLNKYF